MLDMLKRHEIQVLRKAGHSQAETARLAGVSQPSVRRVEGEPVIAHADTSAEIERRRVGRPSKAEPFRSYAVELLAREPELLSVEILRRAKLAGYGGRKSALYEIVRAVRPKKAKPVVRFEGLPGEFSQHDFGQVDVRFQAGTQRRVHFFVSRLKYSRFAQVSLVDDETAESLVRATVDHFDAMGGVPLLAVFDRPKTVALKWKKDGTITEWNSTFAGVMLDLSIAAEVCWPYSPQQKGAVENLVGWVKGSFFKQRRFLDDEDLRRQLAEWLCETNTQRPSRATGTIPAERLKEELPRMRPLKVKPPDLALRFPIVVGATGYVTHDARLYSMHPDAIGIAGTLFLYRDRVRLVAGRFESEHPRLTTVGAKSTLPSHRADAVAVVAGKRGKRYLKRQHLLDLGQSAHDYLTELTYRRPRLWVRDVEKLHDFLQAHGGPALSAAFARGLADKRIGAEYVANDLQGERAAETATSSWSRARAGLPKELPR